MSRPERPDRRRRAEARGRGRQSENRRAEGERDGRRGEEPIWARPAPGERRPAYTREQIARTAIEIADAEGFEAVSMRRIAAELGAGTMTLYHYIRTKEELFALMDDLIMGEILIPAHELPDGWREGMTEIARRTHAGLARHPWSFEALRDAQSGPNGLRHVEQSLAVAARTGLDDEGQFELLNLVDDYVFGHTMRGAAMRAALRGDRGQLDAVAAWVEAQLETGEYPQLQRISGDDARAGFERYARMASDERRFERGLERLLDGVALDLERRGLA